MQWSRRRFLAATASAGVAVGAGSILAGCGTDLKGGDKGRTGSSADTLFIAGFQWGRPTNFSPLSSTAAWPTGENNAQYIYETLVRFNLLTGKLEPGLSTGLQSPDPSTILIPLQKDIHFQDGKPLTADDVVYTFELAKRHPELSYASFWQYAKSIEKQDANTVVCKLDPKHLNPRLVQNSLATTFILPMHLWQSVEKSGKSLSEYTNDKPVGTGPYSLKQYDQNQIVLQRYDDYWGKT
ncbi:MAG TPA: ABC transporter substrate-binding protein, partial [Mycobacteriales bacterium]|nr:ABC transporter substrate-binding protein [Mycobacteriales bacterium]